MAALLTMAVTVTALATLPPASAADRTVRGPAAVVARPKHKAPTKPVVTKVSPATGLVTGGTKITLRGKNFKKVKSVVIGGSRATSVRVVNSKKITVIAPQNMPGKVAVTVSTTAGRSKTVRASKFTYKDPAPQSKSSAVPKAGVITGTDVAWVTSTDPDGGEAPEGGPWLVGINSGGALPDVGEGYYLPADSPVFPGGLAGTVTGISSQTDDITAVTVTATPLDGLLDSASALESGPGLGNEITDIQPGAAAAAPDGAAAAGGAARRATPLRADTSASFNFPSMTSSFFACKNSASESTSFGGSLNLSLANTRHDFGFDKGNLFAAPYVSAWVRTDITLTGKVSSQGKITCKIRDDWAKQNQKIFQVGAFIVKIKPEASFSISGTSSIKVSQTTRRMIGFAVFNNHPKTYNVRTNLGLRVDAIDLSTKLEASAGIGVRVLYLGAFGGELQALLSAQGKVTAKARPRQACVDLAFGVKFVGSLVVDLWIKDWKPVSVSVFFPFASWNKCTAPIGSTPDTSLPTITTTQLPSARRNASYGAYLQTADGRSGTWAIDTTRFPVGLFLDLDTGAVYGTPTAAIGTYRFVVSFTDDDGQRTSQVVSIYVSPPTVGGGDFQATLTWGHFADMDLHVTDPAGAEIYYANRTSDSGGQLDHDANAGCGEQNPSPVENIYWPPNGAPAGTYLVQVVTWSACGTLSQPWRLTVRVRGVVVLNTTGNGTSDQYEINVADGIARVVGQRLAPASKGPAKQAG